jgi:hypothetical protein
VRASNVPAVARQEVVQKAAGLSTIIKRVDRTESKLATFADFLAVQPNALREQHSVDPSASVWLVAMGGQFQAMFSPVAVPDDNWIVIAYDASNGQPVAMMTGHMNTWPSGWSAIKDRATP